MTFWIFALVKALNILALNRRAVYEYQVKEIFYYVYGKLTINDSTCLEKVILG